MEATKSSQLTDAEKIRIARNEYQKAWRAKNKQKVKRNENNYWLRRFEQSQGAGAAQSN